MVDPGNLILHAVVKSHAQFVEESGGTDLYAVAEADSLYICHREHGAGKHGHGIGIIEKPGIRTNFLYITGKIQHYRNGAKGTEHTSDAKSVCNSLAKTVLLWNFKICYGTWVISACLNGVYNVVGTAESILTGFNSKVFFNPCLRTVIAVYCFEHGSRFVKTYRVDVIE